MGNELSGIELLFLQLLNFCVGDYFQKSFIFVKEEFELFGFEDLLESVVGISEEDERGQVSTLSYFLNYGQRLQKLGNGDRVPAFISEQLEKSLLGLL